MARCRSAALIWKVVTAVFKAVLSCGTRLAACSLPRHDGVGEPIVGQVLRRLLIIGSSTIVASGEQRGAAARAPYGPSPSRRVVTTVTVRVNDRTVRHLRYF
jgi:hypothetical protein